MKAKRIEKILITGGAGFIGSHTVDLLTKHGYQTIIVDNLEPQVHGKQKTKPDYINKKATFIARAHVYVVEIEKVLPGRAVCIINEKWRARLVPEEYEGPPNLIKKNMKLKVRGTLYHEGKTLCIQVQRVTEIL